MSLGSQVKSAIKRSTSWGTAVSPGAGNLLIIDSDSVKGGEEAIKDVGLNGSAWGTPGPLLGSSIAAGGIVLGSRFATNIDLVWALAMGSSGSPTSLGSGAYTHKIDLVDSLTEQFTFWMDKVVSSWRVDSAMVSSIGFTATLAQRTVLNLNVIGRNLDAASGVSLSSATEPENTTGQNTFWNLNKAHFYINAASGATLTSADILPISEFSLQLDNNLATNDFLASTDCAAGVIAKPTRVGQPGVSGSFSLPEYAVNTWRSAYSAKTEYKIVMEFCGPTIPGSASTYTFRFSLPRVRIAEMPDNAIPGPDRIPNKVMFHAYEADSAPSGMTAITKPLSLLVTNARSTTILS
jgi:hypothetical protein